ncbi:receptor-type tyrosine-protein phosphatase N2-like protein [Leptotrombidium deliense]|uniref:Receptor-type tyrosine-protein phosphatase N2-like protein n=1 Tax=Leptotrombidium deliense TaxID=299467 RepID=A0A443SV61_9ACAR|nr:receptor-type tyrosine-protein phosphatase N2-like protein [Leptotrombidium deliense]
MMSTLQDKIEIVANEEEKFERLKLITIILASLILSVICVSLLLYYYKRGKILKEKLININEDEEKGGRKKLIQNDEKIVEDYQDLCRQRYQNKENEKKEKLNSSSEDSCCSNQSGEQQLMDVATGHMILEFMEAYLKKPDYLDKEWESLCLYESDGETLIANLAENRDKNRFVEIVPYDSTRIILNDMNNEKKSDYINASCIYDCDPRHGLYVLTQGPLKRTVCDFWQMIWEQNVYIIVCLTRLMENSQEMSFKYWPDEGSQIYFNYEIHLVSEHIWSDDYLVRSFYLKNLTSNETRTVTQFHYISWPQNSVPSSTKSLLEFRSDGVGRSGTYCLLDMVLNRLAKGAKEMDIEATLEHIRDQRGGAVTSKQQFEFALKCVVDQVYQILQQMK